MNKYLGLPIEVKENLERIGVTVKHLLPHGKDKREWTVCFLDYCLLTEDTEEACWKNIALQMKCGGFNLNNLISRTDLKFKIDDLKSDLRACDYFVKGRLVVDVDDIGRLIKDFEANL